jgi:hypothetical protein
MQIYWLKESHKEERMERLRHIKNTLIDAAMAHMSDLRTVDTAELGEVIDMIKDIEEAIYYCHVSKAMESKEEVEYHTLPYMEHESRMESKVTK